MQAPKSCGGELIAFHPNCVAARARNIAEHGHGCLGQGDKILRQSIVTARIELTMSPRTRSKHLLASFSPLILAVFINSKIRLVYEERSALRA